MIAAVLILMLAALCCSHFFSASETAFFSLRKVDLVSLGRSGDKRGKVVAKLLERPHDLLVTVLLGNMVVNVFYSSLSVIAAYEIAGGDPTAAIGIQLSALAVLILAGEITPKYISLSDPERMSVLFAAPMMLFKKTTAPAAAVAKWFSEAIVNLFVRPPARPEVTSQEFDVILKMGEDRGVINGAEEDFLQGVMDMREVKVSEIMTPRVEVSSGDVSSSRENLERIARKSKHSKLPVFEGNTHNVVGVIHVKDFIFSVGTEISDIVRPVEFVPETMLTADLLMTFRKEKKNFAVVVDEYGDTAGVVTLEDVMEEVVGEIEDKYDQEKPLVHEIRPGRYAVDGGMSIREWNEQFGTEINEEGVDTISGYLMSMLDRPPVEGDVVKCGGMTLRVTRVVRRRATEIMVEKRKER